MFKTAPKCFKVPRPCGFAVRAFSCFFLPPSFQTRETTTVPLIKEWSPLLRFMKCHSKLPRKKHPGFLYTPIYQSKRSVSRWSKQCQTRQRPRNRKWRRNVSDLFAPLQIGEAGEPHAHISVNFCIQKWQNLGTQIGGERQRRHYGSSKSIGTCGICQETYPRW